MYVYVASVNVVMSVCTSSICIWYSIYVAVSACASLIYIYICDVVYVGIYIYIYIQFSVYMCFFGM